MHRRPFEGRHLVPALIMILFARLIVDQATQAGPALALIQSVIPSASFGRHYGKEMSFILPYDSVDHFPKLFKLLDEQKKLGRGGPVIIEDYGISMTTLEEVSPH